MASHSPPGQSRTAVFTDLYDSLATVHHAEHAQQMATELLRRRPDGTQLVGVIDAERVAYYSPTGRTLVAYRYDRHGIDDRDTETLSRSLGDAESWVAVHGDRFEWVHPELR